VRIPSGKTPNKALAKWWQSVLGLRDWQLDVEFLSEMEFAKRYGQSKAGYCDAVQSRQWAVLAVNLEPDDDSNPEHSLVHEQCHVLSNGVFMCVMRLIEDYITDSRAKEYAKDEFNAQMEIMTDKTASAFMRLKKLAMRKEGE
jgi:hypothetical protein